MRTGGVIAVVLLLMLPAAARGATLDVSGRTAVRADSNVSEEERNDDGGLGFDFGPTFTLTDDRHDLSYQLLYDANAQFFVTGDTDGDAVNQRARGRLAYDLDPQTRITASNTFSYREGIGKAFGDEPDEFQLGTPRTIRNVFTAALRHVFAPDLSGQVDFSNRIFDTDDDERNDSVTWSGGGNLMWTLSPRQRAGAGFSFTRQDFDDARRSPGVTTDFYQGTAFWDYRIDPTWTVALSLGPVFIDSETDNTRFTVLEFPSDSAGYFDATDPLCVTPNPPLGNILNPQAGCNRITPLDARQFQTVRVPIRTGESDSDTNLTLFGSARITKTFPRGSLTLSYTRSESATSGLGTSSIRDLVALNAIWRPRPRWDFGFSTGYSSNKSSTDQTVATGGVFVVPDPFDGAAQSVAAVGGTSGSAIDIQRYDVNFRFSYRFAPQWSLFGDASYANQDRKGDRLTRSGTLETVRGRLGVRYSFRSIYF